MAIRNFRELCHDALLQALDAINNGRMDEWGRPLGEFPVSAIEYIILTRDADPLYIYADPSTGLPKRICGLLIVVKV